VFFDQERQSDLIFIGLRNSARRRDTFPIGRFKDGLPLASPVFYLLDILAIKRGIPRLSPQALQLLLGSYIRLALKNESADFYYALGVFYVQLGKTEQALESWKKALLKDDRNPQVHFDLGMLYSRLGQPEEAIRELGAAVSGFNRPHQKREAAAALNALGEAYLQKDALDTAQHAFGRARTRRPRDPDIRVNLGLVKMKRGLVGDAARDFERVLRADPKHAKALLNLGICYLQAGKGSKAMPLLEQALKSTPEGDQAQRFELLGHIGNALTFSSTCP
jgi:tetratricopeptide (TPR) repeat protein